ncbi:MAG TPA: hypothetical protein VIT90_12110 [Lysobacter sp.]
MNTRIMHCMFPLAWLLGAACGNHAQAGEREYRVSLLESNGGPLSRGNSINNLGWVSGYSTLADLNRHATLWRNGRKIDLGTLGGPNSSVAWPVKNDLGLIVGISQTDSPEPLGENWSCSAFFGGSHARGFTCLGFVWWNGVMKLLPTLGGNNGYAAGANNLGQVVGWAENTVRDPTCVPPQVLQFQAVVWEPLRNRTRQLLSLPGDSSSAATAVNDRGQVVGISGICDQSVGRHTARHAVLWERGAVIDLGNIGGDSWNTPTALNRQGDVVGFASLAGSDPDDPVLHAFLWTRAHGMRDLGTLPGDTSSQAQGINARGQVVGLSCGASGCRAFLWENGVMRDLNALKAPQVAVHLESAMDINEFGQISGRAIDRVSGERPAYLAVPSNR